MSSPAAGYAIIRLITEGKDTRMNRHLLHIQPIKNLCRRSWCRVHRPNCLHKRLLVVVLLLIGMVQAACGRAAPAAPAPVARATADSLPADSSSATPTAVSPVSPADIDALFADIAADEPGAALVVLQGRDIIYAQGYGVTDLTTGQPITPDTVFHIGSSGKQFTGLAIMLLAEANLLDYDDPITDYLPELETLEDIPTIRQLLHHTAGIPDYYDDLLDNYDMPDNDVALEWLEYEGVIEFTPGSQFAYSNAGYEVLGTLVERISEQRFGDFLHIQIFEPLAMERSFSLPNLQRLDDPLRARGYEVDDSGAFTLYDSDPLDGLVGSGSVYASAHDLGRYMTALLAGELVSTATLEEGLQPAILNDGTVSHYGFGWDVMEADLGPTIGHSGAWQGFLSYIVHFQEADLTVIVLTNRTDRYPEDDAFEIAALYLSDRATLSR